MPVVTSDLLTGLLTNYRALFEREFHAAENLIGWNDLAMRFDSQGESESYNWLGTVPKMQDVSHKMVDIAGLLPFNFSLTNREYQVAIEVERMAIERDRLGLITPRIQQLALEAARHTSELVLSLVAANANGFDGAAFFADTRVIGASGNIDNNISGTGTTIAAIQTDIASAVATMRRFKDDQGRVMNLRGNAIMIPPELEQPMWQALNRVMGDAVNNQVSPVTNNGIWNASGYTVIENPFLTDTNDWFMWYIGGPAERPFIFQNEKDPVLEADTDPNDRDNILKRTFLYSVYKRCAVGLSDPRMGVRITQ